MTIILIGMIRCPIELPGIGYGSNSLHLAASFWYALAVPISFRIPVGRTGGSFEMSVISARQLESINL